MKWTKRIFKIILSIMGVILLFLIIGAGLFFYKPTLLINPKNITYVLNKTKVFEKWSWSDAHIQHEWIKWNERHIYGDFRKFCFLRKKPYSEIEACLDEIKWDFIIRYEMKKGFIFKYRSPLSIHSSKFMISSRKDPNKKDENPPNATMIWKTLWLPFIPDINLRFDKIVINNMDKPEKKPIELNIQAEKVLSHLHLTTFGFDLNATPKKIIITGPEKVILPFKLKTRIPLSLKEIKLVALIQDKKIPITAEAKIESAALKLATTIDKDSLNNELGKPIFLKKVITATTGSLVIEKVKETIKKVMRPPFNILPAPFNALEGYLNINLKGQSGEGNDVKINLASELNMRSKTQAVHFVLDSSVPYALDKKELKGIEAELVIKRIALQLPQLARNRMPPQMVPDKRFKSSDKEAKKKLAAKNRKKKAPKDLDIKLEAIGNDSFNLKTNLLDDILRLNFDLSVNEKGVNTGYVSALPFKTTFFKRPINLKSFKITFNQPIVPQILAQLVFELPEYKITLDIEGPINEPRHAFKSVPPLPLDDIYSVLLFGQPLSSLDDTDKEDAQKTSELLSKGILSLAVLYYFAGTPVESIGYDPDTDVVTAQVGLGEKSSLHVSGEEGGLNSAGVRRSLGKGWYIDSSVQKSSGPNNDFGVLLERIISY
jgi:hypothetical protein